MKPTTGNFETAAQRQRARELLAAASKIQAMRKKVDKK